MATPFQPRDVTLRDGRTVHVRAIHPTDEEELLAAFDRMDSEARYMRFMTSVRNIDVQRLRRLLDSFPEKGCAIAAVVPAADGIDIVATAGFVLMDDAGTCEYSTAALGEWGGVGLASALGDALMDHARERGLKIVKAFILATNRPMLKLAARLGFTVGADPHDHSMRVATLVL